MQKMYYVKLPEAPRAPAPKKQHNFRPLVVPRVCSGLCLGAIAMFFSLQVAVWCAVVIVVAVIGVGMLALLPVAEGLDTVGIGH